MAVLQEVADVSAVALGAEAVVGAVAEQERHAVSVPVPRTGPRMAVLEGAAEVTVVAVEVEVAIVAIIARVPGSSPQMSLLHVRDGGGRQRAVKGIAEAIAIALPSR